MNPEESHAPEQTIWSGRPAHWNYFGHYLLGLLIGAAMLAAIYYLNLNGESAPVISSAMPWAYGLALLPLLVVFVLVAFQRFKRFYSITDRRAAMEIGLIVKNSNEIRIQDIRSINVSKSGIGGWLGIGTIEFSSAASDDAEVIFFKVAKADQIRDIVRKLQS
jgi:uncharacterized membrane protein YdbT with pleckstrin-like domain